MTNRNNQLVLNIRCAAKQAAKLEFVFGAGRDMGGLHPTAVPSVGRPPVSSGSPVYQASFSVFTEPDHPRLTFTEGNIPGMRTITGCWRVASLPVVRNRRVANSLPTAHENTAHHDYPSHDARHDHRLPLSSTTVANNGK